MLTASLSRAGGGVSEALRALARSLTDAGSVQVTVYGVEDRHTEADLPGWDDLPASATPVFGPRSFAFSPGMTRAVLRAPVDLVHVHGLWTHGSIVALRWRRRTGGPTLVSPHGMLDRWALRGSVRKSAALLSYEGMNLRGAGCLHALNAAELEAIRAAGLTNPVCVIANGVTPPASPARLSTDWRERLPAGSRVLLHLGRIHPKKGVANLVSALAILRRKGRLGPWHLAIAGWDQDAHEAELLDLAATLGIGDRVHAVGPRFGADREAAFHAANIFVLPSFSEGLPMAVLEAWASGLPVVMTDHCNLPEGFAVGAAVRIDTEPLLMALQLEPLLALDAASLGVLGRRGRALVAERFSWEGRATELAAVYRWLLGRGARPDCVEVWKTGSA